MASNKTVTDIQSKPISISLNFDSLNEAYGFPKSYKDPSFFQGFERLHNLVEKYQLKMSIYIIGKDLEHPEHFAQVRKWSELGYEIGNHSWTHHFNLGQLSDKKIIDEIKKSHDLIGQCTGIEPKGFIAPAWNTSKSVIKTLIDLNYEYDTSLFSSCLLYPMTSKIALNHWQNPKKAFDIFARKDWFYPLSKNINPHPINHRFKETMWTDKDSLTMLPLPTTSRFQPALWHTIGFIFGWDYLKKKTKKLLQTHPGFYYLIHPGDFMGTEDLHPSYQHSLERMEIPLSQKLEHLEESFRLMSESPRPKSTMLELARSFKT